MRKLAKHGRQVLPGIWQLSRSTFIIRAQPKDPITGRKLNVRRVMEKTTRAQAILAREALLAERGIQVTAPRQSPESFEKPGSSGSVLVANQAGSSKRSPTKTTSRRLESVGDFAEDWLDRKKKRGDLAVSTAEKYAIALDHLSPRLLATPMGEVTPEAVENWMLRAITPVKGRSPERYKPVTVNGWRTVLRTMFNDAMRPCDLQLNPFQEVKPFTKEVNLEEPNSVTPEQLVELLRALDESDPVLSGAIWTQSLTGLRWGEVSALMRRDLDERERSLVIRRKVVKGHLVPSTKTNKPRTVGVPVLLLERIQQLMLKIDSEDHAGRSSGLLFPSTVGKPLCSSRVSKELKAARARAGIEVQLTSHGLRHTMTDLLRHARVDPIVAGAVTGHDTEKMRVHYSRPLAWETTAAGDAVMGVLEQAGLAPQ